MPPRDILLIEPGYPNKYPPLGLMKLATYHGSFGRGDRVTFVKGEDKEVLNQAWDRVYVTTLFTFEWEAHGPQLSISLYGRQAINLSAYLLAASQFRSCTTPSLRNHAGLACASRKASSMALRQCL